MQLHSQLTRQWVILVFIVLARSKAMQLFLTSFALNLHVAKLVI